MFQSYTPLTNDLDREPIAARALPKRRLRLERRFGLSDCCQCWSNEVAFANQMGGIGVERGGNGAFERDGDSHGFSSVLQLGDARKRPPGIASTGNDTDTVSKREASCMERVASRLFLTTLAEPTIPEREHSIPVIRI